MDIEREEGEMSDDNEMLIDDKPVLDSDNQCTVLYKAEKTGVVVKTLEKIDASKLEERAKRFGLNLSGNRIVTQKQIDELYSNCGIESGNERHFRFDTLFLYGVDGLSTKEIFEYLEDYRPVSLEWIDDNSCNVVCQDHISAALAILVHSREIQNDDLEGISTKYHWREGMPHPKVDNMILMRFATNGDKKVGKKRSQLDTRVSGSQRKNEESNSKNPWGDLCKSWGIYDHQELFQRKLPKNDYEDESEETIDIVKIKNKSLAMRLGKRNYKIENDEDSSSDSEWKKKSKTPRMRMRADDEESKKKRNVDVEPPLQVADCEAYAPLSVEVVNTKIVYTPREGAKLSDKFKSHNKPQHQSIRSRLGSKINPTVEEYSSNDESSSDNSEVNEQTMSRVQKVDNNLPKSIKSSVWSRLEEKHDDHSDNRDLRNVLKSKKKQGKPDDLRGRLGKLYKSNLRIEIDNDVHN